MADKAYEYMDWARVEAVVYGEENLPREILGPHKTKKGILLQCFFPGAKDVKVQAEGKEKPYRMVMEDETGYFAALLPGKTIPKYTYSVEWEDGTVQETEDPYRFGSLFTEKEENDFCNGSSFDICKKMGAHPMKRNGVKGIYFCIWAPNALAVSVVGDFNKWNGLAHPMHKSAGSGIYELFLPCAKPGDNYKYEMILRGGARVMRTDPYAMEREAGGGNASVVPQPKAFSWKDQEWINKREQQDIHAMPLSILEVNILSWARKEDGSFLDYEQLGEKLIAYVKEAGYTHVEFSPLMEFENEESGGYATTGYFAPTSRLGKPQQLKKMVNDLHQQKIGVLMDWTPAHFPAVSEGLQRLDGTCLYEYGDPARKLHPFWGTMLFKCESPMVREFLIGNALYWMKEFHIDGLRFDDLDAMLYLDFGREPGSWQANMYGGNENLAAVDLLKTLSRQIRKEVPGALLIAQEDGLWPALTGEADEKHMGFDFKWNNGWTGSFLKYLHWNNRGRSRLYEELTAVMAYAYCEKYILTMNSRDIESIAALGSSLPGTQEEQQAVLKAAFGYLFTHPGKKMMTAEENLPEALKAYLSELMKQYQTFPALYELDDDPQGFEWIQSMETDRQILAFVRKGKEEKDMALVVCNFSKEAYSKYEVGVPCAGKYKEVLNSDNGKFGGSGCVNPRVKTSRKKECDEREDSITLRLAPYSIAVFRYEKK